MPGTAKVSLSMEGGEGEGERERDHGSTQDFHVDVTYIVCMYGIVGKKLKNHLAFIFAVVKFG